jgi:hypothetical protein
MYHLAILVGNINYAKLQKLECCKADLQAMHELLSATEKYSKIETIEDAAANDLKSKIRALVDSSETFSEIFFYFTGHGYAHDEEFYLCGTNFDVKRPNETGLSTEELHTLLRMSNSELVVKVVDACNSGTHLIKSELGLNSQSKQGFRNLIQISSCLANQASLTGNPLSLFTEKFRNAALSKSAGIIYYTDVIAALRDEFIASNNQIPFFVSQYTGREQFVEDACRLAVLRTKIERASVPHISGSECPSVRAPSSADILRSASESFATSEEMERFSSNLFAGLKSRINESDLLALYSQEAEEYPDFRKERVNRFIVESLAREKRYDKFVTAEVSRRRSSLGLPFAGLYPHLEYYQSYDLRLNCKLSPAQLSVVLVPSYESLSKFTLIVSCVPSLDVCYIFAACNQHMLKDFGKFEDDGVEILQFWYKANWKKGPEAFVTSISEKVLQSIREHIEDTVKRLQSRD